MSANPEEPTTVIFDATEESNLLNTKRHDSFELSDDDQQSFIQASERQSEISIRQSSNTVKYTKNAYSY